MSKHSVDKVLTKAKSLAKKGKIDEAQKLYLTVLQTFPQNKRAQQGLAELKLSNQVGVPQGPSQNIINQLINLYNQGQLAAVVNQAKTLSVQYPRSFVVWNILGAANKALNKFNDATEAFKKVTELNPTFPDGFNNLGVTLQDQGILDDAIKSFTKALSLKPDYPEAYYNLGNAFKDQGQLNKAITSYNKALSLKPEYTDVLNNRGIALKDQGQLDEAIDSYKKALLLKPDYAEAYNNMGIALNEQGKLDEAIETFKKALSLKPDYAAAWTNGAETLDKWNKLEQLELWLEDASAIFDAVSSDIKFLKAKLLWRKKDFEEATSLITEINFELLTDNLKQDFLVLKAKHFEKSKNFDQSYACFSKSNELAKETRNYANAKPENYFKSLKNQLSALKAASIHISTPQSAQNKEFTPVFLVGFPRSGTTLLDTILRSHSQIKVVEEKPIVDITKNFLENNGYNGIANKTLSSEVIREALNVYETEFRKHIDVSSSVSVYIDKFPLNLLQVPWIQQIYPHAKFILALRHPFDAILSCWMQNFKLNAAMANMVDLKRIVEFYSLAMETFKICRAKYNLSVHEIKYEDLLEDLNGETSSLLKFLELDWESQMENYQETAMKRGRINTPSYSQVVQPIYKDAKYRWLNYEKYLAEYINEIEPWLEEFDYVQV